MIGGYMYSNIIDNLNRQKDKIDELIKGYQTASPVNNFINTGQTNTRDMVEWRILNENEEVDNLYVQNKTLFLGDTMMVLKGVDGKLEKWDIKKTWPIDKKDEKINQLEEEVRKLKEVINEYTKPNSTVGKCKKSDADDIKYDDTTTKTNGTSISK